MGEFVLNTKQSSSRYITRHIAIFVFISIVMLSLFSNVVHAAIISGSIYDLALQPESNVIVEINTIPKQMLVSKSGEYAFSVKPGNYTLHARTSISESIESVNITEEGNYTLDIILGERLTQLPDFTFKESDINVSLDNPKENTNNNTYSILFGIVLIIAIGILGLYLFMYSKKLKSLRHEVVDKHISDKYSPEGMAGKPLDEYEQKLLSIIKKEKRTTQKDIRKAIPLSEAKISLIITDLESKGKIRKIKRGRGNILIFVKD